MISLSTWLSTINKCPCCARIDLRADWLRLFKVLRRSHVGRRVLSAPEN